MRLDLHVHTTASDGALTPAQVVAAAVAGGLDVIAVTDHDTAAGVAPARAAAEGEHLTVVAATELSSTHESHDIHILGYGIDPVHPAIEAHRARARRLRLERMSAMLGLLAEIDVHVTLAEVTDQAGPDGEILGRPHLARALVKGGWVDDFRGAFDRYIADDGPAFVPTDLQTPVEAIDTIRAAGGVSVWAHPPRSLFDDLLPTLVEAGLDGLEALRPGNSGSWTRTLRSAAGEHGLLVSGGSDWHNRDRNVELGAWWVTRDRIATLADRLGLPAD